MTGTSDLRELLLDAVPPLPEPENRVAAVTSRVRRTRIRTAAGIGLAAVAVLVALTVPSVLFRPATSQLGAVPVTLPPPPALTPDGCPVKWINMRLPPLGPNRSDPLVPAAGVVSVSLCSLPPQINNQNAEPEPALTLTTRVDELIAALNALPILVVPEGTILNPTPGGLPTYTNIFRCTLAAFPQETFVIRYAGDPTPIAVVSTDRNCGTVEYNGAFRTLDFEIFDTFLGLYRSQLAAALSPADIAAPACGPRLTGAQLDGRSWADRPRDDMQPVRGNGPFLPSALAVAVACRYSGNGSDLTLTASKPIRENLTGLRDLLNVEPAFRTGCGNPDVMADPITEADTILVADVTGAVAEVRVLRAPCQEVVDRGPPSAALLNWLNATLDG